MPMSINRSVAVSTDQATPSAIVLMPGGGETVSGLGVTMAFKTVGAQSGGQWLALEYTAPPQFAGPPPHWHKVTTEIFFVLEGTLTLTAGDETIQRRSGRLRLRAAGHGARFLQPDRRAGQVFCNRLASRIGGLLRRDDGADQGRPILAAQGYEQDRGADGEV